MVTLRANPPKGAPHVHDRPSGPQDWPTPALRFHQRRQRGKLHGFPTGRRGLVSHVAHRKRRAQQLRGKILSANRRIQEAQIGDHWPRMARYLP